MDQLYPPPGDSSDFRDTRPIGAADLGGASQDGTIKDGSSESRADGRGVRGVRWGVGIAAGALLLCGAAAAGVALSSGSPAAAGPTGQAAVLNSMLGAASSPASAGQDAALTGAMPARNPAAVLCRPAVLRLRAAGRPRAALFVRRACLRLLLPRPRLLGGIHGQFTFSTASGPRTLAYERGVIESASATAIVVRAPDGTTWTWQLAGRTVVRYDHRRAAASMLSAGQRVFAGGPVSGGRYDARLIVIRPAAAVPAAPGVPAA
jgi:hypothetical protein